MVRRPVRESHEGAAEGLRRFRLEAVRKGKYGHLEAEGMLLPKLADGRFGEIRHLFPEFREGGYFMGEAAGDADALLRLDHVLEFDAGNAAEFLPGAPAGEGEDSADRGWMEIPVVPGRLDAHGLELLDAAPADSPDVGDGEFPQDLFDVLLAVHVTAALEFGILLAELGGNLGEGLGRGHADGHRDGGQPPATGGEILGETVEVDVHAPQVEEGLVDGVDLDGGRRLAQDGLDPPRHVPVEGEIAGEDRHAIAFHQAFDLEKRVAHLDAERLGFVGTRHRAAVVVGQHDDRFPVQFRTENPFARGEEIVAVGKGEHLGLDLFNNIGHHAPDEEFVLGTHDDGLVFGIGAVGRQEPDALRTYLHLLDGVFAVDEADGLAAV